ncbi:MAG: PatA/PatG family cyanobactin maturation protease [Saprospiraceae bacterium]|nr:PatA/PatG family cyanobactin maturation protease [Saprospiraceae bacterium]
MINIKGIKELQRITSFGSSAIKIAVLDGPVDTKHSCFHTKNGKIEPHAVSDGVTPSSKGLAKSHGTAVASIIFGKQESDVDGVAPGCNSVFFPIYSEDENGNFRSATQVDLAKAISQAVEEGAHIINISGGQLSDSGEPDHFLKKAIEKCHKAGVLIVAAVGNDGCDCLHVPAADEQVLAVGSLDENDQPTSYTNYGAKYQKNGILVQGKNLKAARKGGGTFITNGATSYAAPVASGIVGLLMSLQIQRGLTPNAYAIKSILEHTAIPCVGDKNSKECRRLLGGKLNLDAAINEIKKNPGVLASGLEFSHNSKIKTMEKNEIQNSEVVNETTQEASVMTPADQKVETIPEVQPSSTEDSPTSTQVEPSDATSTDQNNPIEEVNPSACGCSKKEEEEPEVQPSDTTVQNVQTNTPIFNNNEITNKSMENQNPNLSEIVLNTPTSLVTPSGQIDPSDCSCGGNAQKPAKVYALGTIGYDFGSEAHRDSLIQSMGGANPHDPAALIAYLEDNPWDAEEIIWTLDIDLTPVYSLVPHGPHAQAGYRRILDFLKAQINGNIERISVPGISTGSRTLLNGQKVALLIPRLRGMYSWTTEALVDASTSGAKGGKKALAENVHSFLNRIYYQMRNLGVTSQERALNYSATNAFQVSSIFASALKENLELKEISATKSPICRPGSDCYDIILSFFNPEERLNKAIKAYRFTVDVSDIVPVTVGTIRSWSEY